MTMRKILYIHAAYLVRAYKFDILLLKTWKWIISPFGTAISSSILWASWCFIVNNLTYEHIVELRLEEIIVSQSYRNLTAFLIAKKTRVRE